MIQWDEGGQIHSEKWHSENGIAPHQKIQVADDTLTADIAYRLACEGTAMLYKGDFQNARQLLQALVRRVDKPSKKSTRADRVAKEKTKTPLDTFNLHRLAQSQRARILGMVLIPINTDHSISLRRAPEVARACLEAYGEQAEPYIISLREITDKVRGLNGLRFLLSNEELVASSKARIKYEVLKSGLIEMIVFFCLYLNSLLCK